MVLFPRFESKDKKEKSIEIIYLSVLKNNIHQHFDLSLPAYTPSLPPVLCEKVFISIIFGKYFQFPAQFF